MFFFLAHVGFDLANAREVVVQEGVHGRGGDPLLFVAGAGSERVQQRPRHEERHGREGDERDPRAEITQHHHDDGDLKHRDDALLDAVDQDALDSGDILQNPGHEVARGPVVEPAKREQLDVGVKVAAQIEDDVLLEHVVEHDSGGVEHLLEEKGTQSHQGQRHDA